MLLATLGLVIDSELEHVVVVGGILIKFIGFGRYNYKLSLLKNIIIRYTTGIKLCGLRLPITGLPGLPDYTMPEFIRLLHSSSEKKTNICCSVMLWYFNFFFGLKFVIFYYLYIYILPTIYPMYLSHKFRDST